MSNSLVGFALVDEIEDEDGELEDKPNVDLPQLSATREQILRTPPKKVSLWPLVYSGFKVVL